LLSHLIGGVVVGLPKPGRRFASSFIARRDGDANLIRRKHETNSQQSIKTADISASTAKNDEIPVYPPAIPQQPASGDYLVDE